MDPGHLLIYVWHLGWSHDKGSGAPQLPPNLPPGRREHWESFQDLFGRSLKEKEKKAYFYSKTTVPLWGAVLVPSTLFYWYNCARRMCVLFCTDMSLSSSVCLWRSSEFTSFQCHCIFRGKTSQYNGWKLQSGYLPWKCRALAQYQPHNNLIQMESVKHEKEV